MPKVLGVEEVRFFRVAVVHDNGEKSAFPVVVPVSNSTVLAVTGIDLGGSEEWLKKGVLERVQELDAINSK